MAARQMRVFLNQRFHELLAGRGADESLQQQNLVVLPDGKCVRPHPVMGEFGLLIRTLQPAGRGPGVEVGGPGTPSRSA